MTAKSKYRIPFARYPAVRIVLLLIAGILLENWFKVSPMVLNSAFVLLLVAAVIFELHNKSHLVVEFTKIATFCYLIMIVLFGWIWSDFREQIQSNTSEELVLISDWEELNFRGEVLYQGKNSSGKSRADIKITETMFGSDLVSGENYKARLLTEEELFQEGDTITFIGTVIPVSEKRNPYQFDYKKYLKARGITSQIKLETLISVKPNRTTFSWTKLRNTAIRLVEQNFNEDTSPIAKALLLGYKQDLEGDSRRAFARAGLSHIMAVSGLHVGFIIAPFWMLIPLFWTLKYGRLLGFVSMILLLWFYAGLTGFSASVMRASLTAILLTGGKLFSKSSNSINLTAVAAVILLVIDPTELYEIGFQLSFSAVLIILVVLPTIQNWLPYWVRVKWYAAPLMVVIVSIVVQVGLYPLQVFYFGEISLISPLANALFVPFLGLIVPFALICIILSSVLPVVGAILNYPALLFLQLMKIFVETVSSWEWSWREAELSTYLLFPFWLGLIVFTGSWRTPEIRWKYLILVLILGCVITSESILKKLNNQDLQVTIFDVGQGDATLIETPNGKTILIDAGIWRPGYNSGSSVIIPHLKATGIKKLNAVILSHPHADHIGGIIELIKAVPIDTIYNSGYQYDSNLYRNYLQLSKQKNVPVKPLSSGDQLMLDPSVLMLVLGPDGTRYNSDPNQHSVILNVIYGKSEFLFTGDSGEDQEERLVETYGVLLDTDFLKVGHHGSRTSSGEHLLEKVTPNISVVSLAEKNRFGHPHQEAIERLYQTESNVYFTSRDKALIFRSNGENIKRVNWN